MADYISDKIKCPFYRKNNTRQSFTCDGFHRLQTWQCQFENPKLRKAWQEKYCQSYDYLLCPHAKELIKYS